MLQRTVMDFTVFERAKWSSEKCKKRVPCLKQPHEKSNYPDSVFGETMEKSEHVWPTLEALCEIEKVTNDDDPRQTTYVQTSWMQSIVGELNNKRVQWNDADIQWSQYN
uniref:Uncharacterized protein n=1 Tax=Branchiostoma floridae TaxID=7739 RepID=C3ZVS1_BRAFL|eukprot:XP_002587325.1 hypothetical protein BRAFLDRAFT_100521 [Branchiostoma floridae]